MTADPLSDFNLGRCWRTKGQSVGSGLLDRCNDFGMGMAHDGGAPGADVIHIAVAVGIPAVGAPSLRKIAVCLPLSERPGPANSHRQES